MKTMKKQYQSPAASKRRIFLETGIAAKASILISSAANIQQQNWTGITDEAVGDGTDDMQGDVWFLY
jgi:hypothetical protein